MQTRKASQPQSFTLQDSTSSKTVLSSNKVLGHNTVIKLSTSSNPPSNPPNESKLDERSCNKREQDVEKLYISLIKQERAKDDINALENINNPSEQEDVLDRTTERERDNQDIYIFSHDEHNINRKVCDMGLPSKQDQQLIKEHKVRSTTHLEPEPPFSYRIQRRRGSYKKKAVTTRIAEFLNQFEELYPISCKLPKNELEYWIQRLGLAYDRVTVKQYIKQFLMHGYFSAKYGTFTFRSKQPKQPTIAEIMNVQNQIMTLRAVTVRLKGRAK